MPVVIPNVLCQDLDNPINVLLALLGDSDCRQKFLKRQMNESIFSRPSFHQQPSVVMYILQELSGRLFRIWNSPFGVDCFQSPPHIFLLHQPHTGVGFMHPQGQGGQHLHCLHYIEIPAGWTPQASRQVPVLE